MFFGSSAFAVPSLVALAGATDVVLVVTQPDRPAGRGMRLAPTPVKRAAAELGIETIEPQRLRDVIPRLERAGADLFAVASYGKIVPQAVLDIPRLGALNVHPSLLPLYRGATPLQSVLRDGQAESGVSIILMDAGMDTGDIVLQERAPIGAHETYGDLHERFAELGARMLLQAAARAAAGTLMRIPQRDVGASDAQVAATLTRPLSKDDLEIDWSAPARRVVDLIRALSPEPGARATFAGDGERVKILAAHVAGEPELALLGTALRAPGTPIAIGAAGCAVACGEGYVVLDRVVPPGRRAMSGREFASIHARSGLVRSVPA